MWLWKKGRKERERGKEGRRERGTEKEDGGKKEEKEEGKITEKISAKELAAEVEWNPKYLSQVLNSRVNPKGAEEKLTAALDRIIQRRQTQEVAG